MEASDLSLSHLPLTMMLTRSRLDCPRRMLTVVENSLASRQEQHPVEDLGAH